MLIVKILILVLFVSVLIFTAFKFKEKIKVWFGIVFTFFKNLDFKETYSNLDKSGFIDKIKQAFKFLTTKK